MHSLLTFLFTLALSTTLGSSAPSPVAIRDNLVTLPFSKRINITSARQILEHDQARAAAFRNRVKGETAGVRRAEVPATDRGTYYAVNVQVGTPGTSYSLLIDTGSSNTFVGTNTPYRKTSSAVSTGNKESVTYGSGSWSGDEYLDTVAFDSRLTIYNQSIGVATQSQGFSGIDGILGIGPRDLTRGTVRGKETVPTVTDNLFSQGSISNDIVSIYFQPSTEMNSNNGELTFGGIDHSKVAGRVVRAPITSISPSNQYWGIDQKITYGHGNPVLSSAGIVDTGSTLLLLATDAFRAYQKLTGAIMDDSTGLLRITPEQYANLKSLFFNIAGTTFEFIPDAQIWPRALNRQLGGSPSYLYLIISDIGSPSGSGLDFINGMSWLERFYSVYDTGNKAVGIAKTAFTNAVVNSA